MTEDDFELFDRVFRRVVTAFRLKLPPTELTALARLYFQVLDAATLDQVLDAGHVCIQQHKRFPTAADWLEHIDTPRPVSGVSGVDRRWLSHVETDELARATALRYEDDPCGCPACRQAGVDHRPIRFVPTTVLDGELDRAWNPSRNRVEVCGHWAHGDELVRYYTARDQFFALAKRRAAGVAVGGRRTRTGRGGLMPYPEGALVPGPA